MHLESIPIAYSNRMGTGRRLVAFERFARMATRCAKTLGKPDVIFGTSTPLSVGWAARKLARHWDVPWVFEVRDLWPDFPIQMGAIPGRWLQQRLRNLERDLYRDANHIVALSPDMAGHITSVLGKEGKVSTLVNGTSFELAEEADQESEDELRRRHGLGDRRVVLYAGALGRANGIPQILEAARQLRSRDDLVFVFVGRGYHEGEVTASAGSEANVIALPSQPKHAVFAWHRLADLALVTFIDKPVLATNSPSKFFDSLSSGTPVLVTNPGWTRHFVDENECGWWVDGIDPEGLARAIASVFDHPDEISRRGRLGSIIARRLFDRRAMADELEATFERLARG